ncbi:hypothetical protein [Acinetobacter sp. YH12045]|uniref:hypothetical protein n=1 Tax=Acinetobacter sp. YH12045 TaxID=2601051 RepID=UPI0015D20491|nr:hypothetical protein [Acinetobacter sp. YH12045]
MPLNWGVVIFGVMKLSDLDQIFVPKGTLIHIDGMPFEIKEDTYVLGFNENAKLTTQLRIGAKDDKRKTN